MFKDDIIRFRIWNKDSNYINYKDLRFSMGINDEIINFRKWGFKFKTIENVYEGANNG
jgi:hypothetical protein